ncbi:valine--tRNA ligase [Dinghuibacter silviterrae]|uniref:Valine--tRNA ligase n=1 Tax=Dinghuibacter silviterrae TaxID=1539049 RepID=A0A4R8DEQ4_9BACT|nr:valine--tRNA ligase [Dinghuibacter silviterrae]TDW96043.1 valyl-tRNA synthetase [Dinghuibacter silviterrae]
MELSKNYIPSQVEDNWYQHWLDKRYFNSKPDNRKAFTVVIPPPNVTGVLHMGHTLNETVQDTLVRKARMNGYNACWVPGSDHASIATEARVVNMLKEKGIEKSSLTREAFLRHAFEWKDKYGGIIYSQIRKLGCSVDWDRVSFTMDDHYYKAVIRIFIDLYGKGLIYRGARMINWDPKAKTALSDEEVEYKELQGQLYHVRYPLLDASGAPSGEFITIATQRPETIMGDTAICVNPGDERYRHLRGWKAVVPLVNRPVPIIFDDYVDPTFGTGALKVTPAHDINDYNLGLKHHLPIIDTLNDDGTLSAAAEVFVGEDRFVARKKVVAALNEAGLLVGTESYATRLGYSQRNPDTVVEPRISTQWFLKMQDLAGPALAAVNDGDVRIHPGDKFLATYRYWLENVKDWCISRQLWWGQQIPAFFAPDGTFEVAATVEEALAQFQAREAQPAGAGGGAAAPSATAAAYSALRAEDLRQDPDVLDTWFSSWIWPIEVFHGITQPGNAELKYYYPTTVLVTGQDIIFFWVARMIMAGMEFEHLRPFDDVYFTGMVRDKQGRKMSKSLGNSPDLLDLIDRYGADSTRFGIMIAAPAGNDLLFDEASLEQGRNFNNKLWNALKLVKMWEARQAPNAAGGPGAAPLAGDALPFAVEWFDHRLREVRAEVDALFADFRLSEALKTIYSLIWDDFCSWYLEWVKPGFEQPISAAVYAHTVRFFDRLMELLHPYMPFITEEIYHLLKERAEGDDLCIAQWVASAPPDKAILEQGLFLKNAITSIRDARNKQQIKPKDLIQLWIQTKEPVDRMISLLQKQTGAENVYINTEPEAGAVSVVVGTTGFALKAPHTLDTGLQKAQLQKDLDYQRRFLDSVEKKLGNERFVAGARPEVIELERKKKADALAKIKTLEENLLALG